MRVDHVTGDLSYVLCLLNKVLRSFPVSSPSCTEIRFTMQEFPGTQYETSEQHKEFAVPGKKNVALTTHLLSSAMSQCKYNMKQVNNTKSLQFQEKKKRGIDDTSVVISNEPVQVDPQLMFQRLHAIATRRPMKTQLYYLSMSCALFDTSPLPRVANKPAFADEIWDLVKHEKIVLPTNVSCRGCLGLVDTQLQPYVILC